MARVLLLVSEPGGYADGLIRGNPQDFKEIADEDSNSGNELVWIDAGLNLGTGKNAVDRNGKGTDKLLVVVARAPCDLVLTRSGQDPDAMNNIVPIPVAEEGLTQYACLMDRGITNVYVRFPAMPDEEPDKPWYLAWWPF